MGKFYHKFFRTAAASILLLGIAASSVSVLNAQQTFNFTTAGATGQFGPTQTQVSNAYSSTPLAGKVTANGGIQYWVVPQTGLYHIEAFGAQGYGPYGGRGAQMTGDFILTAGDTLKILVGQKGAPPVGSGTNQYGGGGGSFITRPNNTPIIIAGGGGGSWASSYNSTTDAPTGTAGKTAANGPTNGTGGTNGSGGADGGIAGGGGGLLGDGGDVSGGKAYINGGTGGRATTNGGEGGFGGGGGANSWDNRRAGGGGGYSGGGGAGSTTTGFPEGGGGGSYNSGLNQSNLAGVQTGDGKIIIKVLSSGAPNDAGVIAIDSPNVYCSGTHNVVVTIQNYGTKQLDSAYVNWSVNGSTMTPVKFNGTLDTFGGTGSPITQINLGSYSFPSTGVTVKVWTTLPNGVADTVNINDTVTAIKQANLPAPTGIAATVVNPTSATIKWNGGSKSNSWTYWNVVSGNLPTGAGTTVSVDSANLSGLSPSTTYNFYVKERCPSGDSSSLAGPYIYRTPCSSTLSGTYTVNSSLPVSSTNFVKLSDATGALLECGVTGPVTINIAAGTYTGQVILTEIPGASATNTVTLDGGSTSSVTLRYSATSTADMATVLLNGTDWLTIKNMRIEANNTSFAAAVHFANNANHNTLTNNVIVAPIGTSNTNLNPILGSGAAGSTAAGAAGDSNLIANNVIRGGYYGIRYQGPSTTVYGMGNKFNNNDISDFYTYGMYIYYQNYVQVFDNKVYPGTGAPGTYGSYIYYPHNFLIERNLFRGASYNYLYYANYVAPYNSAFTSTFNNNTVIGGTTYGLYFYYCNHLNFYNNTIRATSGTYGIYAYNSPGNDIDMRNNIFSNGGTAIYLYNSSLKALDYNIYDGTINITGTVYNTLAEWQAAYPTLNLHSYQEQPDFVNLSNNDLHLVSTKASRRGTNVGVVLDIDKDARCVFAPSIGSDESKFPEPFPTANFLAPDTVFVNSPTTIYNAAPGGATEGYQWFVDGVAKGTSRNLQLQVTSTGTLQVKLMVQGCGGSDSVTKTVLVANPVIAPTASFVADRNTAEIYQEVRITDLSSGGAIAWKYVISPDSVFDPTIMGMMPSYNFINSSEFSQNPVIVFNYPGKYSICQTATNAIGSHSTCHNDYIVIRASSNMCLETSTTVPSGTLYDDGGPSISYSNGRNGANKCTFLIDPCASEVTLNFNQLDLASGDYLRLYDGSDNTGTPLWNRAASANGMTGTLSNSSVINPVVAHSGKLYIEFETDATTNAAGFAAEWTSIPGTFPPPVASFEMPDTACINLPVGFEGTSTGSGITYSWDVMADGLIEGNSGTFEYTFTSTGTFPVKLLVKNCGGEDTITKNVIVVVPNAKPRPGFMADITRPSVGETVLLNDTTEFCADPNLYEWSISPSSFVFVNGTDEFSVNPQVKFMSPGIYDVMLKVENSFGSDAIIKPGYIQVIQYCTPVINALNSDAGIRRVVLGDINNLTEAGQQKFTNYSENRQTQLERKNMYLVTVERPSSNNPVFHAVWIDFNQDGDFDDADETIVAMVSAGTTWMDTVNVPANAVLGATRMRVAIAFGTSLNPCGPAAFGEFEDYRIIITRDQTQPVITLTGADTVRIERCGTYTDAGATAEDNIDGNITSQIITNNAVNTSVAGNYIVRYNVEDVAGNMAVEVTRIVIVLEDTTKPVIAMNGANPDTVDVNMVYTDPSFTASDNCSGIKSQTTTGTVNTALPGPYTLTYTVEDSTGNVMMAMRTVVVADRNAPVLTLIGNASDTIEMCSAYNDMGATSTDNFDANVNVGITSNLDNQTPGSYMISYCATDAAGNGPACINREVVVLDRTAPVITMTGTDTVKVEVLTDFDDPGVNVTDLCNNDWSLTTSGTWTGVASQLGCFSLIYTVTDASGNSANATRTICVEDNTAPTIELIDDPVIYLKRFEVWTDPKVVISDNFDQSPALHMGGNYQNSLMPGTYFITYQAEDQSGNKSKWLDRLVIVSEETTGISGNSLNDINVSIYPNPNSGLFNLELELPQMEKVRISVLNAVGQEIEIINDSYISAGRYTINLAKEESGLYFVRIQTDNGTIMKKVNVVR